MTIDFIHTGLPIEKDLDGISSALEEHTSLVISAEPGAGKSTLVPFAVLSCNFAAGKKIVMLEPRRAAARSVAGRMAHLLGETVGKRVGYRTRDASKISDETRIEVVTEAILTKMLQNDPALENVACIIFDEFHERSIHCDLALALALDARENLRNDLRIVVMSATLDTEKVSILLGDAETIVSEGRTFPVRTIYSSEHEKLPVWERTAIAAVNALRCFDGSVLAFLPGEYEIRRAAEYAERLELPENAKVMLLYGSMSAAEQDKAIAPCAPDEKRLVFSTSIAETSLTIDGIKTVVDCGLARKSVFSVAKGMDVLTTGKESLASAEQRKGRAGRTSEGVCVRLWNEFETGSLSEFTPPEIVQCDLASAALELAAWGLDRRSAYNLKWSDPPPRVALEQAFNLLHGLGAVDGKDKLTSVGKMMNRLSVHPRLARAVAMAEDRMKGARIAAILGEKDFMQSASCDVNDRLAHFSEAPASVKKSAERIFEASKGMMIERGRKLCSTVGAICAAAYPDRIGMQRELHSGEYVLACGITATAGKNDAVTSSKYVVAASLVPSQTKGGSFKISLAAPLDVEEVINVFPSLLTVEKKGVWDEKKRRAVCVERRSIGSIVLSEKICDGGLTDEEKTSVLLDAVRKNGLEILDFSKGGESFLARCRFLHFHKCDGFPDMSEHSLLERLDEWLAPFLAGAKGLDDVKKTDVLTALKTLLGRDALVKMETLAPERFTVPTGSKIRIDYSDPAIPLASVRLQELFGLNSTPLLAGNKVPLVIDVLSPAMRTVQRTADLNAFWDGSYFLVRKEMRGRYPKHDWPEDPRNAPAHRGVSAPKR